MPSCPHRQLIQAVRAVERAIDASVVDVGRGRAPLLTRWVAAVRAASAMWGGDLLAGASALIDTLSYLPERVESIPARADEVIVRGGDDCDGLAVVSGALCACLGLPWSLMVDVDEAGCPYHIWVSSGGVDLDPSPVDVYERPVLAGSLR